MNNPFQDKGYNNADDLALIQAALAGNRQCLSDLLKRHQPYIYNIALKMLNNIADAEDTAQEILIKIVTQLSKYDSSKAQFRTWLYRITFNHVLNMKKNQYETIVTDFNVFFNFIDDATDIAMTDEEEKAYALSIEESKVSCMAGMLMCLDRMQRLVYIVGEVFEIEHNLASEIFEISPDNFRQKLFRARKDLYQWMHNRCGLVNTDNPCRCKSKTKSFIQAGYVDPSNLKWLSNYKQKMYDISESRIYDALDARDEIYKQLYKEHPFKISIRGEEAYSIILDNTDFSSIMNLKN